MLWKQYSSYYLHKYTSVIYVIMLTSRVIASALWANIEPKYSNEIDVTGLLPELENGIKLLLNVIFPENKLIKQFIFAAYLEDHFYLSAPQPENTRGGEGASFLPVCSHHLKMKQRRQQKEPARRTHRFSQQ